MFSRFDTIPSCDGQTDVHPIAKTCFRIADARNESLATNIRRYIAIFQKWLKIDGYMLRGVLQALNSLSIHVKFTAIVPGTYPGKAKMCKKMNFWTYGLNYWETVKDRWVHAVMRLAGIEFLSIHVIFTAIVPLAYPGEAKMCLRLSWRSPSLHPQTAKGNDILAWLSWGSQIMCLRP